MQDPMMEVRIETDAHAGQYGYCSNQALGVPYCHCTLFIQHQYYSFHTVHIVQISALTVSGIDLVKMHKNTSTFVADIFNDLMDVAEEMSKGK